MLPPPTSTLFPYTTLFRSEGAILYYMDVPRVFRRIVEKGLADMNDPEGIAGRDRKSTRLNSSHANISYAVFCLKKKKQRLLVAADDAHHDLRLPPQSAPRL